MYLTVSGSDIGKYVQTLNVSYEPIWNTKAGRTTTADFQGRIINNKWTLEMQTIPLSQEDSAYLHSLLRQGDFVRVEFVPPDQATDTLEEATMYVSSIAHTVYSYANGLPRYRGLSFSLIEK